MISKRRYVSNQRPFGCNAPQSETVHSSVRPVVCQNIPHCWAGASSQRDGWGILSLSLSLSFFLFSLSSHFFQIGHFSFPLFPYWKKKTSLCKFVLCPQTNSSVVFSPHKWKKRVQTNLIFRPSDVLYSSFSSFTAVSGASGGIIPEPKGVCPLSTSEEIKKWCIILPGTHCALTLLTQQP